ncbi:MAG: serine hydrolase domain-containing protein [Gemmatimonadota bacterium]
MRTIWMLALGLMVPGLLPGQRSDTDIATGLRRHLTALAPFGASGAVVLRRGDSVIFRGGFGEANVASHIPMTVDAGVDIASMSKQVTATAVVRLIAAGTIHGSDSIGTWFPDVPADKAPITIAQLLLHRSGLPQFVIEGNDFTVISRDSMQHAILGAALEFPPGTDENYSDAGYTLLAMILERQLGAPWEEIAEQRLFAPMSLIHTSIYATARTRARDDFAHGYLAADDHGTPRDYVATTNWWGLKGAGGVLSSADDLANWEVRLGATLGGPALDSLLRVRRGSDGVGESYYGTVTTLPSGERAHVRTGAQDFGFSGGVIRYATGGIVAVVVLNRQPEGMDISMIRDALLRDIDAAIFDSLPTPAPSVTDVPDAARLAGVYQFPDSSLLMVSAVEGKLLMVPRGALATAAIASSADDSRYEAADRRAQAIVAAVCAGDSVTVGRYLSQSRSLPGYMRYIQQNGCAGDRSAIQVLGTLPRWYASSNRDWLVTLMERPGAEPARFRFEWTDSATVGALGGSGIAEPEVRFGAGPDGRLIGYHLGIRAPIMLRADRVAGTLEFAGVPGILARKQR